MKNLFAAIATFIASEDGSVLLIDRPALRAAGKGVTPDYTDAQVEARKALTADLSAAIQRHIENVGAFETPSNKRTSMLLALSIMLDPIEYTDASGSQARTRPCFLNISAPVNDGETATAEEDEDEGTPVAALSRDEIMAQVRKNKADKKAARAS